MIQACDLIEDQEQWKIEEIIDKTDDRKKWNDEAEASSTIHDPQRKKAAVSVKEFNERASRKRTRRK